MAKAVVIVQARMTSTRLPGKVMMDLAGHTVLAQVLHRCAAIPGADSVCCAIPAGNGHDELVGEIERAGASVFRGSEEDVLDRYFRAAEFMGADVVVRVTSDCPLADPDVCGRVLRLITEEAADYACNNMPASWPHGLDCEAFTFSALALAAKTARQPSEREHVTPWLRSNPGLRKANLPGPGGKAAEQRWTLDFPEDYRFLVSLFERLPPWPAIPSTAEVLAILARHPDILDINRQHHNISRLTAPGARKEAS
jgi:spore coat polysaccharide biosynthesis protein SpsF